NPDYMKSNFFICIETLHCGDNGTQVNAHELPPEKLKQRDVVFIDIANDNVMSKDYKESEDPTKFRSIKTGRGPLTGNWRDTVSPVMTCYKLVTVEFKWFGLQNKVESFIQK
ncbi:Csa-PI transferase 2-like protein, partial [Dinothrombium tinctorium]